MRYFLSLILLSSLIAGCGDSSADCVSDADCFNGETCNSGTCGNPQGNENNVNNVNNVNNQNNVNNVNNSNNANNTSNNVNNFTNGPACVIDPFGNQCQDDEWEENDRENQEAIPYEGNSWCDGTTPVLHTRTFAARYCANDDADVYRFAPRMWAPQCVPGPTATVRITIEILTECDPSSIRIEPFDFFRDASGSDLCNNIPPNDDINCTIEDNGATRIFEFLEDVSMDNQIWDNRVFIEADANIQFDYTLTVEII